MLSTRTLTITTAAAAGLLMLAGCKSVGSTVSTTAVSTAKATAAAAPAAAQKPAGLGAAIDVTDTSGDKIAVTLVAVDPKTQATDGFSTPDAGDSYYAAQIQIKDVGSTAWSDDPSNCLVVKDGKGQEFQTTTVESISSGPLMNDTVNLAAGGTSLGWLVFEVPTGDQVTQVQFTPDSGMGEDTAQWSVS
jgi:hypothetical protein